MNEDHNSHSLIPLPDVSLSSTTAVAQRIMSAMVGEMLSIMNDAAVRHVDLDALVSEAKRLYHQEGEKMTEGNVQAFNLFFRAAVAGHSEGQFRVSACYKNGRGTQENLAEAEEWLRKAAANEFPQALFLLAIVYQHGTYYPNIAKDEEEAIKWWQKAAEKGYFVACFQISNIYKMRHDDAEQIRWTKEAALRGYDESLWDVKNFYERREPTKMDLVEAYAWLLLFADYSDSETKAGKMEAIMSPSELEKANHLYRDYKEKRSEWERRAPKLCYRR